MKQDIDYTDHLKQLYKHYRPLEVKEIGNSQGGLTLDDAPEEFKVKKIIPIGDEIFIPEIKIGKCDNDRVAYNLSQYRWKISIKSAVKSANESWKRLENKAKDSFNNLLNLFTKDDEKIKELENEKKVLEGYVNKWIKECGRNVAYCSEEFIKPYINKIKDLEEKINILKKRKNYFGSIIDAKNKFNQTIDELTKSEEQKGFNKIKWPEGWNTPEELKYLPTLLEEGFPLPETVQSLGVDIDTIKKIPIDSDILRNIKQFKNLDNTFDIDSLKDQVQLDEYLKQIIDIKEELLNQINSYDYCLYTKNTPARFEISISYIKDYIKLVEYYIYGCFEKAKQAAIYTSIGFIPSIISSYGATIFTAITSAISVYWNTLKDCLINIYQTLVNELTSIFDAQINNFQEFMDLLNKYVRVDIDLQKRSVPWELRYSLFGLIKTI